MVRSLANYPDVRHQISGLEHGVEKKDTEYGQFNFSFHFSYSDKLRFYQREVILNSINSVIISYINCW